VSLRRLGLLAFLALAVYAGFLAWQNDKLRDRELKARAAMQGKQLVDAGWLKGVEANQRELEAEVPALKEQLAAVKKAKATTAIVSHWEGHGAEVAIPCTVVMPSTSSPAPTGSPEAPPSVAVTPHVRIDDAVALDDAGGIFVARKVQAQLTVGSSWASAWEDIVPDAGSTTKVAPEIEAAWKAYRNPPPRVAFMRPFRQWRAGGFLGPALTIGIDGKVDVALAVGWGIQF
jgi:hypothetical protein